MTDVAADFKALLPKVAEAEPDDRPHEYLWVYDPQEDKIHLEQGHTDHPAHFPVHREMATQVTHPERQEGYAYSIVGGWRITDDMHKKIEDPHMLKLIRASLRGEHPAPALPNIRYHGDPSR
jgi:hypothetical protein